MCLGMIKEEVLQKEVFVLSVCMKKKRRGRGEDEMYLFLFLRLAGHSKSRTKEGTRF